MSTDFLRKKGIRISVTIFAFAFTLLSCCYAYFLTRTRVENGIGQLYFLVAETTNVEVTAQLSQWDGGAGYFIEYDGVEYVASAVYFKEEDGLAVQAGLLSNGKATKLLRLGKARLYFKSRKQKQNADAYLNALRSFYGCLQVFGRGVSLLEKGTQEEGKRYYAPIQRQLNYLEKEYGEAYPSFAKVCKKGASVLNDMSAQTLYVKDLRRFLCELSLDYVVLIGEFSL